MNDARNEFIRATFMLSKSDPSAWEHFYVAFSNYAANELERGIGGTTADMQVNTGMSRRMIDLRNDFRDIQTLMERVTTKR
jgi:hypothetical protein